jgi:hypothetical protein
MRCRVETVTALTLLLALLYPGASEGAVVGGAGDGALLQLVKTRAGNYCAFLVRQERPVEEEDPPHFSVRTVTRGSLSQDQVLQSLRYAGFDEAGVAQSAGALTGATVGAVLGASRSGLIWRSALRAVPVGATLGMVVAGVRNGQGPAIIALMSASNALPVPLLGLATEALVRKVRRSMLETRRRVPLPDAALERYVAWLEQPASETGEPCELANLDLPAEVLELIRDRGEAGEDEGSVEPPPPGRR